jgi:hypothetical protein
MPLLDSELPMPLTVLRLIGTDGERQTAGLLNDDVFMSGTMIHEKIIPPPEVTVEIRRILTDPQSYDETQELRAQQGEMGDT